MAGIMLQCRMHNCTSSFELLLSEVSSLTHMQAAFEINHGPNLFSDPKKKIAIIMYQLVT